MPSVGNLVRPDGSYLGVAQSCYGNGLAFGCKKLGGVALAALMRHHNCPDVTRLQTVRWERLQKNNSIELLQHLPPSLSADMRPRGGEKSRLSL